MSVGFNWPGVILPATEREPGPGEGLAIPIFPTPETVAVVVERYELVRDQDAKTFRLRKSKQAYGLWFGERAYVTTVESVTEVLEDGRWPLAEG